MSWAQGVLWRSLKLVQPHHFVDFRFCVFIFLMLFLGLVTPGPVIQEALRARVIYIYNIYMYLNKFPITFQSFSVPTFRSSKQMSRFL